MQLKKSPPSVAKLLPPMRDSCSSAKHSSSAIHARYRVVGVIERDGGTLYCTALFFSPDCVLMGKYRILMPTALSARRGDCPATDSAANGDDVVCRGVKLHRRSIWYGVRTSELRRRNILTATIDLGDTICRKFDFDVIGHYARPDVFRLIINEADTPPVRFVDGFLDSLS